MSATATPSVLSGVSSSIPAQIRTSIGKKILAAISGFAAVGYVIGHMLGNLQIFLGRDQINQYADFLHSLGPLLWVIRIVLLTFFVVHIWLGIQLKLENWRSRPIGYRVKETVQATLASRTMIYTGLLILAFFVYHILHFTSRVTNPQYKELIDPAGRFDAYSMIVLAFQNYWLSGIYIVAVFLVAYHLSHSISSMFQTMGWSNTQTKKTLDWVATVVAVIIFAGFASIPVSIMTGLITLPEGGL